MKKYCNQITGTFEKLDDYVCEKRHDTFSVVSMTFNSSLKKGAGLILFHLIESETTMTKHQMRLKDYFCCLLML
jgi:hypothetical protein